MTQASKDKGRSTRKKKLEFEAEPEQIAMVKKAARLAGLKHTLWVRREVLRRAEAVTSGREPPLLGDDATVLAEASAVAAQAGEPTEPSWKEVALRMMRVVEKLTEKVGEVEQS